MHQPSHRLETDDELFGRINLQTLHNPMLGNLFQLTGVSLLIRTDTLPVGLMLLAQGGSDAKMLAMAKGVQDQLELR